MNAWKEYQEKNKDRFLNELMELLRIPSVSARSEHKQDMLTCAEAVKQTLIDAGVDKAEVFKTDGHPVVYAETFKTHSISLRALRCTAT
jgi:acetylornithine deacetylase/succinyl-diaminopimelate desuccinylase-like protein